MPEPDAILNQLLVVRSQAGDDVAFEQLVLRFHQPLRYYLRRMLDSADHVDDVLQETWLAAYRTLRRLRRPESFVPWIYRIARNRALSRRHDAWHWKTLDEPGELVDDSDPEYSPDEAAQIHRLLDRLACVHREVLLLRFFEQMSYEQMAEVIGCQLGTVRSRLHHAKNKLKQLLDEEHRND